LAFTEDLAQFFDSDSPTGYAVPATFKNSAGATIRSVKVLFTDQSGAAQMFDNQVLAAIPFLQCKTSDLVGVDNTCSVLVASTTYRIVEHHDDGTGTSVVQLRK
jgi:hypothetical protein